MFKTIHVSSNATTTFKQLKIDNVLINVVVAIPTHNQQSKHVFKEKEPVKIEGAK